MALFFGCSHQAGRCDCDPTPTLACPCYGHAAINGVPGKPIEPIKEAPKPNSDTLKPNTDTPKPNTDTPKPDSDTPQKKDTQD
jgi:hypothetical protein